MAKPSTRDLQVRKDNRGGKRPGAGRKPRLDPQQNLRVRQRPSITERQPVHVVLWVLPDVGSLRRSSAYEAIRLAMLTALELDSIRIVHVSLQRDHLHLLVEADDEQRLARGLKGLQVSAARRLNRAITFERRLTPPRRGQVFVNRYQAEVITTPKQARHALASVLNTWRRHREDRASDAQPRPLVDPYSSGIRFDGWAGLDAPLVVPAGYDPLPVAAPTSWLLTVGWKQHGAIGLREVPEAP